jgi:hypothetical protein
MEGFLVVAAGGGYSKLTGNSGHGKSEIRSPKSESNPNVQIRNPKDLRPCEFSAMDFGFCAVASSATIGSLF